MNSVIDIKHAEDWFTTYPQTLKDKLSPLYVDYGLILVAEIDRLRKIEQQHDALREAVMSWDAIRLQGQSCSRVPSDSLVRQRHEALAEVLRLVRQTQGEGVSHATR